MRSTSWILASALFLLLGAPASAETRAASSARDLVREMARASGIKNPERVRHYEATFDEIVAAAAHRAARADTDMKKARSALDVLYARMLRTYRESADGIDEVLDEGSYNCVSGTLLAGAVARSLGLDARVLVVPRHLLLHLRLDGRERVVDTTRRERPGLMGPVSTMAVGVEPLSAGRDPGHRQVPEVDLEGGIAYLWNNRGERSLERDDGLDAARSFEEAWKKHPGLARGWEGMAASLARAFRIEYEARRFGPAHEVAAIDLAIYPGRATATDRLQAAALKQIEILCDSDSPQDAEDLLERSCELILGEPERRRMEAAACPVIARTAVRLGDWPRAFRSAERFAHAERDPFEAERLLGWVQQRYQVFQDELSGGFCPAVPVQPEHRWPDFR